MSEDAAAQDITGSRVYRPSLGGGRWTDAQALLTAADQTLDVALQPIVDIDRGQVFAYEALIRGVERLGFESPHRLYDAAYRLGALEELELRQFTRSVCKAASVASETPPNLFVNIDTRLLVSPTSLFVRAETLLRRAGLSPHGVTFELSERHDKTSNNALSDRVRTISGHGFRLALDDFGCGVSDMRALHSFDVDFMKIDRFFVDGVSKDRRKQFLVGRMIELAHLLGQKVIAEGVETEDDLDACRDLGADLAQGFQLGRPETSATRLSKTHSSARYPHRRRNASYADAVRAELTLREPARCSESVMSIISRFADPEQPSLCAIVGENGEPLGMVCERSIRPYLFSPYGLDLLHNRSSVVRLEHVLTRYPVADIETDIDRLMELLADAALDGVIITEGVRYLGFLPAAAIVKLTHDKRLATAQDANPLTRLPGNRMVAAFIETALSPGSPPPLLGYFDFDNFKPFNDAYGFRTGDRAILLFSDILKKTFEGDGYEICHIGGDDFFVGARRGGDPRAFVSKVRKTAERFRTEVESLYAREDREAGGLRAVGRDGVERLFPLLSVSTAVVSAVDAGDALDDERLLRDVTRAKRLAKESEAGFAHLELGPVDRPSAPLAEAV